MRKERISIIGGGIGGLTLAVALQQVGLRAEIYEQASSFRPVGAGINLACNAMQVLARLGLAEAVKAAGHQLNEMCVTDNNFRPLSKIAIQPFAEQYEVDSVAIHRAALVEILSGMLDPDSLHVGARLTQIKTTEQAVLVFADGKRVLSDLVIGADGLNSQVRDYVAPEAKVRETGQYCWRGVATYELPKALRGRLTEAWGGAQRFGMVTIGGGQVYWFAVKTFTRQEEIESKALLADSYAHFQPLIGELIRATPAEAIHGDYLQDIAPLAKWSVGQVGLLGDAAHAMTPNLGQGACQAMEDAQVLAACLTKWSAREALVRYESLRKQKVKRLVRSSRSVGRLAHWQHPWAIRLRNTLMRMTPAWVNERQSAAIYQLAEV